MLVLPSEANQGSSAVPVLPQLMKTTQFILWAIDNGFDVTYFAQTQESKDNAIERLLVRSHTEGFDLYRERDRLSIVKRGKKTSSATFVVGSRVFQGAACEHSNFVIIENPHLFSDIALEEMKLVRSDINGLGSGIINCCIPL